jgi:hypothetical protein
VIFARLYDFKKASAMRRLTNMASSASIPGAFVTFSRPMPIN